MDANEFLEFYSSLKNKQIDCCMRNGQLFHGVISGFFRCPETNKLYQLHLIEVNCPFILGIGVLGEPIGKYILLSQLDYIKFRDNSDMELKIEWYEK